MIARTDLFLLSLEYVQSTDKGIVNRLATECAFGQGFIRAKYNAPGDNDPIANNTTAFEQDFGYVNVNEFDAYLIRWNTPPRGPRLVWQKPDGVLYMGENGVM